MHLNYNIIEHTPGRWYYLNQNTSAIGPFASSLEAMNHLYIHNSRIGLHGMMSYQNLVPNETIDKMIAASKI